MTDIVERLRQEAVRFADMDRREERPWVADAAWAADDFNAAADEIEWLRKERDRLANDLAQAHRDFQPWIAKVGQLTAKNSDMLHALRRIGMPGVSISYCQDGHEMAVLIARDALKDGKA